jgi:hypothetical protein
MIAILMHLDNEDEPDDASLVLGAVCVEVSAAKHAWSDV